MESDDASEASLMARPSWWRASAEYAEAVVPEPPVRKVEHPSRATRATEAALEFFCAATIRWRMVTKAYHTLPYGAFSAQGVRCGVT